MENISENIIDNNNSNPVKIQKNMDNFDRNMNAAQDSSKLISSSNVLNINQCDDISSHESCLNIYVSDKMNNKDSTINKENLDYLSTMLNSSVNIEFLTSNNNEKEDDWKNNWILKEAKAIFTTSVEMLIPAPKEDIHVSIDGKIMDEIISDISETGSDFEDIQHNIDTAHDEILIDDNEKIHISHEIDNTLFQLDKSQHDFQNNNMTLENESQVNKNISESENSEKQINKILHQTLNGSFEEPIIEPPERFNDENSYFDLTIQSISNSEIKANINNTVNLENINSEKIIQYIMREGVEESIKNEKITMNNEEIQKDSQQNAQKSNESDNISVNQADTIVETSKENQINDSHCNCSGRENEYDKESYVAVQNNNKSVKMDLITEIVIKSVNETIEQSSCDTDSKTTMNDNEVLKVINVINENTPDSSTKADANIISTESEIHETLTTNEQIEEYKVCSNETIIGRNETKISNDDRNTLRIDLVNGDRNSTSDLKAKEKSENSNDNFQSVTSTLETETDKDVQVDKNQCTQSKKDSEIEVVINQNFEINENDKDQNTQAFSICMEFTQQDKKNNSTCKNISIIDQNMNNASIVREQNDNSSEKQDLEQTLKRQNSRLESTVDDKLENSQEIEEIVKEDQSTKDNFQPDIVTSQIESNDDSHQTEIEVDESTNKDNKTNTNEIEDISQNVDIIQNNNTDTIKPTTEAPQTIEPSTGYHVDKSTCNSVPMNDQVEAVSTVTDQKDTSSAEKSTEVRTEIVENIMEQTSNESSTSGTKLRDEKISTEQNSTLESIVDEKLENSNETDKTVREHQSATDNVQPLIITPENESNQDCHQSENEVDESKTKDSKADSNEIVDFSQNMDIIQNNNTDSIKPTEEAPQTIEPSTEDHVDKSTCTSVPMNDQVEAVSTVTDQKDTLSAEKCTEITTKIVDNIMEQTSIESSTSGTKLRDEKISTEQNSILESIVDEKLENSNETDKTVREDQSAADNVQPLIVTPENESNQDCYQSETEVEESETKDSKADSNEILDVSQNVDIIQNNNTDSIKPTEEAPQTIEPSTEDHVDKSTGNNFSMNDQIEAVSTVTDQKYTETAEKTMEVTTEIVENIVEQRSDDCSTSGTNQVDDKITTGQNSTLESIVDDKLENSNETDKTVREDQSAADNVQTLIVTPENESNQYCYQSETEVDESETKDSKADSNEIVDVSQNVDIIQNNNTDSIKPTEESPQTIEPSTEDHVDKSTGNSFSMNDQIEAVLTVTYQKFTEPAEKCTEVTTEIVENIMEQTSNESSTSGMKLRDEKISIEQNSTLESIVDEKLENSNETEKKVREDQSAADNVQPHFVTPENESNQDCHKSENEVDQSETKDSKADSNEIVDVSQNVNIIQNNNTDTIKPTEEAPQTIEPSTEDHVDKSTCNSVSMNDQVEAVSTVIYQKYTGQNSTLESIVDDKLENSNETDKTVREDQSAADNVQTLIVTPENESNQYCYQSESEVDESETKGSKADSNEIVDVSQNVDIIQNNNTDSIKPTEEIPQTIEPSTEDHVDKSTGNSFSMNDQIEAVLTVTDQKFTEPAEKCTEVATEIVENIMEQTSNESSTSGTKLVHEKISTEQNSTLESIVDEKLVNSNETDKKVREDQSATDDVQPPIVKPENESNQDCHQSENEVDQSETKDSKADSNEIVDVSQNVNIIQNNNTDTIKPTEEAPQTIEPSTEDHVDKSTCNSVSMNDQVEAVSTVIDQKYTGQNSTLESIVDDKLKNSNETDKTVREDQSAADNVQTLIVTPENESNQYCYQSESEVDESETKDSKADSNEIVDVSQNVNIIQNNNTDTIKPTEEAPQTIEPSTEDHVDKSTCNSVSMNDQVEAVSTVIDQKYTGQNSTLESIVDDKLENSNETDKTVREDQSATDDVQPPIVKPENESNQDCHQSENEVDQSETKDSKADSNEIVDVSQNVNIIQNNNTDTIKPTEEAPQTIEPSTENHVDKSTCNSVSMNDQVEAVSTVIDQKYTETAEKTMEVTTEIVENIMEQTSNQSSTSGTKLVHEKISTEQNSTLESIVDDKLENSNETDKTVREDQSAADNVQPLIVTPENESNQYCYQSETEVDESETKDSKADSNEIVDVSQNVDIIQNNNTDSIKPTEEAPQTIEPSTEDHVDKSNCNSVSMIDQVEAVSTVTDQKYTETAEKCTEVTTEIVENILEPRSDDCSTSGTKQVDDKISTEQNSTLESIVDEKLENSNETDNTVREDQCLADNVQPLIVTPENESNQDCHQSENEVDESETKDSKADSNEIVDFSQNVDIIQNNNTYTIKPTEEAPQTIEPSTEDHVDKSTCNSVSMNDQVEAVSRVIYQKYTEPAEKCTEVTTEIVENIVEQRSDDCSTSGTNQVDDKISTEQNSTLESIVDEKLENSNETDNTVREDQSAADNVLPPIVTPENESKKDCHQLENEVDGSETKDSKADSNENVDVSQNVDIIQNNNTDTIKPTEEASQTIEPSTEDHADKSTCNSVPMNDQVEAVSTVTDHKNTSSAEKCTEVTTEIVENLMEQTSNECSTSGTKLVDEKVSTEQNSTLESIVDEKIENSNETDKKVRADQSAADNVQPLIVTPENESNQDCYQSEKEVYESETKESKADSNEIVDVSQIVDIIQNNNTDSIKPTEEAPQTIEPSTEDHVDKSTCNSVLMNDQVEAVSTVTDQKYTETAEKIMEVTTEIVENILEQRSDHCSTSGTKLVDEKISLEQNSTLESIVDEKLENSNETDNLVREDQCAADNVQPLIVTPENESNQDCHQSENEVDESETKDSKADSNEILDFSQNVDIIQNNNTDTIKPTEEAPQTIEPSTEDHADKLTCNSVPMNDQVEAVSTVTDHKNTSSAEKCTEVTTEIVENLMEQTSNECSTSGTKLVDEKISTEQNSTLESIVDEKIENSNETDKKLRADQSAADNVQPLIVTPENESNQDCYQSEKEVYEFETKESKADSNEIVDVSQIVDIIQNNNTDSIKPTEEAPQTIEPSTEDHVDKSTCNSVSMNDQVEAVSTVIDQKYTEPAEKCTEVTTEIVENLMEQRSDECSTSGSKLVDKKISTEQNSTLESIVDEKIENSNETEKKVRPDQNATDNVQPLIVTPENESNQYCYQSETEVDESETKDSKADSNEIVDVSQNGDIIQNNNTDSIKPTEEAHHTIEPSTEDYVDKSTCNSVPMNDQVEAVSTVTDKKNTSSAEKCTEVTTEIVENIMEQTSNESSTSGMKLVDEKISSEQNSTLESIVDEKIENSNETDKKVIEDQSAADNVQPLIITPENESKQDCHQSENEVDGSETKNSKADSNENVDVSQNVDIIQNNNTDTIKPTEEAPQTIEPSTEDHVDKSTCNSFPMNDQVFTNTFVTERKDISSVEQTLEVTKESVVDIIEQKKPTITTQSCYVINDKLSHNSDIHMISESVNNEKCGQLDCTNSESVIREEQSNERGDNFCDENKNEKSNICIEGSSSIIVNKNFENNNSHSADSSTPSDDNDVIRIYDLNKQKKIIIRQDSTEKITKNIDSKSKPISSKANPSILSVTTKLQSRKIVTPAALKFLQPKRKIFEPEQIMSDLEGTSSPVFEKRDIMPTTTSVISKTLEKTVIEPEVIPALPSVKALAKAFLLTSAKCSLIHPDKLKVKNYEENVSNDKRSKPSPDSYSPPYQQMKYNPIEPSLNQDENNVTDISETTSAVIFCNENDNDQENNNNVPADRPISPVLGVGKLKTNIAFFENLKKN